MCTERDGGASIRRSERERTRGFDTQMGGLYARRGIPHSAPIGRGCRYTYRITRTREARRGSCARDARVQELTLLYVCACVQAAATPCHFELILLPYKKSRGRRSALECVSVSGFCFRQSMMVARVYMYEISFIEWNKS